MVFPGERDCMATNHERPRKTLHNFTFSSWGFQQNMRCMKVDGASSAAVDYRNGGSEVGLEEFREKLMMDIRTVKESMFRVYEEESESEQRKEMEREISPAVEVKPWKLRKRREVCKAPFIVEEERVGMSMRSKFISTLSKKEVEDDMMMMMGHPPRRRPKKRPRTLQKKINVYPTLNSLSSSLL
ncbi:unnamed protein product [Eruca vesicaria subsp. sativa]|uniref:Uncharacterized protein n=1 Tax=Eruca vesicaria subsp. sativa TaxID=29727 RepID=A0ABC8KEN3_ERUVS|nr:unnamed protein product [Eruca vesicaria subsp. sativa]